MTAPKKTLLGIIVIVLLLVSPTVLKLFGVIALSWWVVIPLLIVAVVISLFAAMLHSSD